MTDKKLLKVNTISSIIRQVVTIICGMILPIIFIKNYGSEANGLISSINQFVSLIAFLDLGVGAVMQSTLYKPLAKKDIQQISKIYKSASIFFKKIAIIFSIYIIALVFIYPLIISNGFSIWYNSSLILIISIGTFAQYYFGIVNQLLLTADQKYYIPCFYHVTTLILNTIVTCVLIVVFNTSLHFVKLVTTIIYLYRPFMQARYVRKHYNINYNVHYDEEPIKQKKNGLYQHISAVISDNTDVIILTLFSSLKLVSVYSVYYMIVSSIRNLLSSFTTGYQARFGNLMATNEIKQLKKEFNSFELTMHFIITLFFSCTIVLLLPFINLYTNGVSDTDYILPLFGFLIVLCQVTHIMRFPYFTIILSAGHYKETQKGAIIEALLNITISLLAVKKFGLVGVTFGTLVSTTYRLLYMVNYLRKNIIYLNIKKFINYLFFDFLCILVVYLVSRLFCLNIYNYIIWIMYAVGVFVCSLVLITIIFTLFVDKSIKNKILVLFNKVIGGKK